MAGEIEDRTNFQADCLHSDSVSFGRFESESLSWEKRSSFSRNQYLEEVEKYSTPGSVTKKKAYLEAHFKTKTYLQGLTGTQKGTDGLVENDAEIRDGCVEELENQIDEETLNTGESGSHANDEIQFSWYDVTPDIADGHKHEVEEVESEASLYEFPIKVRNSKYISCAPILNIRSLDVDCGETVTATPLIDPSDLDKSTIDTTERVSVRVATGPDKSDVIVHGTSVCDSKESDKYDADIVYEEVETIPACDSLDAESSKVNMNSRISACDATEPDKNSVDMVFEQKPEDSVKDMDSEQMDSLSQSCPVKIASSSILEKMSEFTLEEKTTVVQEPRKVDSRREAPVLQKGQKNSSAKGYPYLGKVAAEVPRKAEKETPYSLKQSSSGVLPSKSPRQENTEPEDSEKIKINSRQGNGRTNKSAVTLAPTSHKGQADECQSEITPKRATKTTKPEPRSSGASFSFRSSERAEKRKEFYMKLEEKQQAKEAKISQIQLRTQEERDAEIRQLRKSLSFKATPMPSFYHEAAPKAYDVKKATNGHGKPLKARSKCECSRVTGALARANSSEPPTTGDQPITTQMELASSTEGVNGGAGKTGYFPDSERTYRLVASKKDTREKVSLPRQGTNKTGRVVGVKQVRGQKGSP